MKPKQEDLINFLLIMKPYCCSCGAILSLTHLESKGENKCPVCKELVELKP